MRDMEPHEITQEYIARVVKSGNWMIRADNDGLSHGDFPWAPVGEWTTAPDWTPDPVCGGGLHGIDRQHSGYSISGNRLLFCETDGNHIDLGDKVKVRCARILLVNELPKGVSFRGNCDFYNLPLLASLPKGFTVGGYCDFYDLPLLASLPKGFTVGGYYCDFSNLPLLASLPEGFSVGGDCDFYNLPLLNK